MKTLPIIEQHIHGAYGVDFNKAGVNDIVDAVKKLRKDGVGGIFPTLVTDTVENTKRQIGIIKEASAKIDGILGVHLEGIFLNAAQKGIHNAEHFLSLTVENYKKIEDDFIKIVTLAPELDKDLIQYLNKKGVKVQAGHCTGWLNGENGKINGVTHLFNAMTGVKHRGVSTALKGLTDDNLYTEVIADGVHISDEALCLVLKSKPEDKIILISDALPITHTDMKQTIFADSPIFFDGVRARSKDGTIAGSTSLVSDIIKRLGKLGLFKPQFIKNVYEYHGIEPKGSIEWDSDFNVIA